MWGSILMAKNSILSNMSKKKTIIDWGSTCLKVVDSIKDGDSYMIKDLEKFLDDDELTLKLQSFWKTNNSSNSNIILSLNGPETLIRVVDFPRIEKKAVRESLGFELENHTPFSQNDVYFDYLILDDKGTSEKMKLLVGLIKRGFLDERLAKLSEAAIVPRVVALNSFMLANAFEVLEPDNNEAIAVFDLGSSSSMITIINNQKIVLSREIKKGTNNIFAKLQNIVEAKVNCFKDFNIHKHRINRSVLCEVTSDITSEIKISLDFIEAKENLSVNKILVTGGIDLTHGMWEVFSSIIGVETQAIDFKENFLFTEDLKQKMQDASVDFTVALSALF